MNNKIKRFIIINIGIIIMAISLHVFLVPANLAVGGVAGLSMVLKSYFPFLNLGLLMAGFNIFLLILAFYVLGKEFGGYTIFCSLELSAIMSLLEFLIPLDQPIVSDLLLNLIFGITIQGIGMSLIFYQNASTGGTDILAKILSKYTKIGIGKSLFLSDSLITLLAGMAFGLTLGFYAFLGILLNGVVIDKAIAGFETKLNIMIISKHNGEISSFIHDTLERGTTHLTGFGGYTMEDKNILTVILNRKEYILLKRKIREIDPQAFVTVSFVHEVLGEGFNLELQNIH